MSMTMDYGTHAITFVFGTLVRLTVRQRAGVSSFPVISGNNTLHYIV